MSATVDARTAAINAALAADALREAARSYLQGADTPGAGTRLAKVIGRKLALLRLAARACEAADVAPEGMRICRRCCEAKPLGRFSRLAHAPDGVNYECGDCSDERVNAWRARNHARFLRYRREYGRAKRARRAREEAAS